MRADIGKSLALFSHVEEPGGSTQRHAGDELVEKVFAFHEDARPLRRAGIDGAENGRVIDQGTAKQRRHLEPFGHHVECDQSVPASNFHCFRHLRQIGRLDRPRLVGEDV